MKNERSRKSMHDLITTCLEKALLPLRMDWQQRSPTHPRIQTRPTLRECRHSTACAAITGKTKNIAYIIFQNLLLRSGSSASPRSTTACWSSTPPATSWSTAPSAPSSRRPSPSSSDAGAVVRPRWRHRRRSWLAASSAGPMTAHCPWLSWPSRLAQSRTLMALKNRLDRQVTMFGHHTSSSLQALDVILRTA